MKFILIVAVALGIVWLWRSSRQGDQNKAVPKAGKTAIPQDMVCCAHCGVHLPSSDAIQGVKGVYCCAEHLYREEPE